MKLSRPGPCGPAGTPRISRPFKQLSRSRGQVTHVILTRSPLNPPPKKRAGPFDLHVLSTPPAFVLSQDQTLQTKPNPNPNRPGPVQQKPEKKQPQPNPTPPTTPRPRGNHNPTKDQAPQNQKTREAPDGKKQHPKTPTTTSSRRNRAQPDPHHGNRATRTPEPAPRQRGSKPPGRAQAHPRPAPQQEGSKTPGRADPEPRNPPQPATHPNNRSRTTRNTENPRSPRKHDGQARTTPKKERNPNPSAKTTNTKHDTLSRSQTTHPPGLHDPHPRTASSRKRSRSIGQPHVRSRFRTGAGGNRSPTTFQSSASVGSLDPSIPARAGENITHRRGGGQTERR